MIIGTIPRMKEIMPSLCLSRKCAVPTNEVPLALATFNFGIEIGQLLCVAVILTLTAAMRRVPVSLPSVVRQLPGYVIGSLAVFWILERTTAMV